MAYVTSDIHGCYEKYLRLMFVSAKREINCLFLIMTKHRL